MHNIQMQQKTNAFAPIKAPTKVFRILSHLLYTGSLNCFEAQRLGDHCLSTTISTLANMYRLVIHRVPERAWDHWGAIFTVTRYSLPMSSKPYAEYLLAHQGYLFHPVNGENA